MEFDYIYRWATIHDIPALARHRIGIYQEMGYEFTAEEEEQMQAFTSSLLQRQLPDGKIVSRVALLDDFPAASASLVLREVWPRPVHGKVQPAQQQAHILNVYCYPEHRRRGVASTILNDMHNWCLEHSIIQVALHASEKGRPLYEQIGYQPTNEMRLDLKSIAQPDSTAKA